ncbi:GIY-YIG nuclease family protein [Lysobacter sp. GCM10012299]|uniref:GIY-YIG nuclease family protein n=1 Tax=Lysobacter sp. GCM10012299 TaxID=3317333 RepID=UPI0036129574
MFWTYMLRCADGSFYLGHTDDIERRMDQHHGGQHACYTQRRRPVTLVFSQEFPTREEALVAERQIKGWSRAKKLALIDGDWDRIKRLCRGKHRHQR